MFIPLFELFPEIVFLFDCRLGFESFFTSVSHIYISILVQGSYQSESLAKPRMGRESDLCANSWPEEQGGSEERRK
jgi:hypothetical protein